MVVGNLPNNARNRGLIGVLKGVLMGTRPLTFLVLAPVEMLIINTGNLSPDELYLEVMKEPGREVGVEFSVRIPGTERIFLLRVSITQMTYAGDPTILQKNIYDFEGKLDGQPICGKYRELSKGHIQPKSSA